MNRRAILLKNVSANLLLQLSTVASGFILPSLIIVAYGSDLNGLLSSAKQLMAYLDLLEAGIGLSSIMLLYKPLSENNVPERNRILSTTRHLYRKAAYWLFFCLLLLAGAYTGLTHSQTDATTTFLIIFLLGMGLVLDFYTIGAYRVLLQADNKTYALSIANSIGLLTNIALAWLLIRHQFDIISVQYAFLAASLLKLTLISLYTRHRYPDLYFSRKREHFVKLPQQKDIFVHKISNLAVYCTPILFISIFCSLKEASIYTIYLLVFNAIKMLLEILNNGMNSLFGQTFHQHDLGRVQTLFHRFESLFFAATGFVYSCTAILMLPFIAIYTANMTDAPYYQPMLAWLFLLVGLNDVRSPGNVLINAAGHYQKTRNRSLAEASINVTTSLLLIHLFGMYGVLYAALLSSSWRTLDIILYSNRHIIRQPQWGSLSKLMLSLLPIPLLYMLINPLLAAYYPITGYLRWLTASLMVGLPLAMIYYLIYRLNLLIKTAADEEISGKFK